MRISQQLGDCRSATKLHTSGKSTQKAFMFIPYMKLANDSLNRARLSCMSWKCIKFASKSAIESASSAKAGSNELSGKGASCCALDRADSRKDERDDGRRGVVGREVRDLEFDRLTPGFQPSISVGLCIGIIVLAKNRDRDLGLK